MCSSFKVLIEGLGICCILLALSACEIEFNEPDWVRPDPPADYYAPYPIYVDDVETVTYDCTWSYIGDDSGYGPYFAEGGCQNGTVTMELVDHVGTLYDAFGNCYDRGMRLPTVHELSAAGYVDILNMSYGENYWAESAEVAEPTTNHNCYMPDGNCGTADPNRVQLYRCVYWDVY